MLDKIDPICIDQTLWVTGESMSIDLSELWDFGRPEISEKHFRSALAEASAEEALILQTQIARTYGIRGDFPRARQILAEIAPELEDAEPEAKAYYYLEWGRTFSSAVHPPESQTVEAREQARAAFLKAIALAEEEGLDSLAIDALHMLAFVDTAPEDQVSWGQKALAVMQASTQPEAWKWAASLHNNLGYALHLLKRYAEALVEFREALAVREREGNAEPVRVAWWMIAWTLHAQGLLREALEIQLRLEKECDEAGEPDPYVYEELEQLYQALGEPDLAEHYRKLRG
jgi:tetratricopeptide (TPR) repeat protein